MPLSDLILLELVCRKVCRSMMLFGAAASCCEVPVFCTAVPWAFVSQLFAVISIPVQTTNTKSKGSLRMISRQRFFLADSKELCPLLLDGLDRYQSRGQHQQEQDATGSVSHRKYQGIVMHFPAMRNEPKISYPILQQRTDQPQHLMC